MGACLAKTHKDVYPIWGAEGAKTGKCNYCQGKTIVVDTKVSTTDKLVPVCRQCQIQLT